MNNNTMIITPDEVRTLSNISDNVNSKVLAAAIRTVQDDELMLIVGEPLLDKLKDVKENGGSEIPSNAKSSDGTLLTPNVKSDGTLLTPDQKAPAGRSIYTEVIEKARMFIINKVIAELIVMINYKIDNAGLIQTADDNIECLGIDDTLTLKGYYDSRADHYAHLLQNFLIENLSRIPELTQPQVYKIHATLHSAGNPSVFLGGARGRGLAPKYNHIGYDRE